MKIALKNPKKVKRALLRGIPCALLSTLSVSVFGYVRGLDSLGEYYAEPGSGLLWEAVGPRSVPVFLIMLAVFTVAFLSARSFRPGSFVIGLVPGFNMLVSLSMEHSELEEIFLPLGPVGNAVVWLGFAALIACCAELVFTLCDDKTRYRIWAEELDPSDHLRLFFGAAGCILLLWLPILFCFYPGSVHNDTRYQIMGWLGLKQITASHPILTTVFYGVIYQLGMAIGGQEKAIFLGLLTQDVVTAAAMGLASAYVYRCTRSKGWFWLTVAFFGLLPVWQSAAQVLLKDVLHTGCFLVFVCVYLDCLRKREKSWRNVLLLFVAALLLAYTRKATVYLAAICILAAALWHWRTFFLPYLAMLGVFAGLFWFSNNVLYPRLGISGEWESENYSLQFQQVALYCRTYQEEMTDEEIAVINSTLDYDTIVREYTPMISDAVKGTFHDAGEDHSDFWQLYRQMLRRHPMLFVKAAVMGSFEHFNPWFEGVNFNITMARDEGFITIDYRSDMHTTFYRIWTRCLQIPVLRMLIGTGLYAWVLLFALGYGLRKKSGLAVLGLLPSIALTAGLVMSHVNGYIRYGYPLIAAAPLNFAWVLYAVSCRSPEDPDRGTARYVPRKPFRTKLFQRFSEELEVRDNDPSQPPPELPPEEEESFVFVETTGETGPLLGFLTRYVSLPKKTKTYLDVLKVLAIFLVLWNHTSNGFELYARVLDMPQHMLYLCASVLDEIAVPLFFMASGALLLGKEESWQRILRHRVRRFALILLLASAANYVMYYRDAGGFSLMDFLRRLYSGNVVTPLWYLYSYLALLLMLPFLRKLARCMRERDYVWLLGLYTAAQLLAVGDFFWFHGESYHSSNFALFINQNYLVYALCGFYIDRVMEKKRMNLETLTMLVILSVLSVGATYLLTERRMAWYGEWSVNDSQGFFNTFIAIPSVTVFYTAKLLYSRRQLSRRAAAVWSLLAAGTFGTYLFERLWRDTAWPVFAYFYPKLGPFVSSLLHILAACALGILATLAFKLQTAILKSPFTAQRRRKRKEPFVYKQPTHDISDLEEIETLLVNNAQHNTHRKEGKDQKP